MKKDSNEKNIGVKNKDKEPYVSPSQRAHIQNLVQMGTSLLDICIMTGLSIKKIREIEPLV